MLFCFLIIKLYFSFISQTEKDPMIEKFEKLNAEMKLKGLKFTEMEKKLKDALRDADIFKE